MNKLYINRHIKIKNNSVFIDGKKDFFNEEENLLAFLKSTYKNYGIKYAKFFKMDALSKLGFLASELALIDNNKDLLPEQTALIFANSSSSLNTDFKYQKTINDVPSPSVFVYTLPNIVIGEICIRNMFRGETMFFVQDNFDAKFMCNYTKNIFENTDTKQTLLAWIEVSENNEYHVDMYLVSEDKSEIELNEINIKNKFEL